MSIVQMQKVAIVAQKKAAADLIMRLQEEGVLEVIMEQRDDAQEYVEDDFTMAEIDFAIDELTTIASKEVLKSMQNDMSPREIIAAAHRTNAAQIIAKLHELRAADAALTRELGEIEERCKDFMLWQSFDEELPPRMETETCVRLFGIMQSDKVQELQEDLKRTLPETTIDIFADDGEVSAINAFVMKSVANAFEERATMHGWTAIRPPNATGYPAAILRDMAVREREIRRRMQEQGNERLDLTKHLCDLMRVRTYRRWMRACADVQEQMTATECMVLITGWMPKTDMSRVEKSLSAVAAVVLLPLEPDEGEEAPVLIKNPLLITPFESVTKLYGLPLSAEMDPTMVLAPFFALFFALCLTDAGYGLAITVIMSAYLAVTKQTIRKAPLWWAVLFGGITSFFVGIPFGGWFGLDVNKLPTFLEGMRVPTDDGYRFVFQRWNLGTQSGIQFLQNAALVLGITHLFFGMFLAGWHKWVHGQKASAFWEHFTSHILLIAVVLRAFAPAAYGVAATYGLIAAVILIIWGKGYGNPWYLRPVMGVLGVMNFAIGLLSNGLSYLRILALGLVTGAIALAVNQVAIEMGKLFPVWIGVPVILMIAVAGHTMSIALNTLGSFIHAGRLQFIEFFSQFFEGGGRPFAPFSRVNNS